MEQSSLDIWKKYNRSLKQRNVLLKASQRQNQEPWRVELIKYGNLLNQKRKSYFREFEKYFLETASRLLPFKSYEFAFYQGWPTEKTFAQVLIETEQPDLILGFTKNGPHRADFKIKVDGKNASTNLSRGQMKLLIFAIKIAQVQMANQFVIEPHCILIDDLSSELDTECKKIVMEYLKKLETQIFITATDIGMLGNELNDEKVFHVEQGSFISI